MLKELNIQRGGYMKKILTWITVVIIAALVLGIIRDQIIKTALTVTASQITGAPVHVDGFTLEGSEFSGLYYLKPALSAYPSGSAAYPLARPARLAGNMTDAEYPEYYYWPQFVKEDYYAAWRTP